VALNRRLAPDVYLDTTSVVRLPDGRYAVEAAPDTGGEYVEPAVKMRRLPDERTLARLLEARREPPDAAERIAARLVRFHAEAAKVERGPDFAGGPAVRAWWAREYGEAAGFIGATWDAKDARETRAFVDATIDAQQALFDERLAAGRVIDGHGDLHASHVYLLGPRDEELVIVDCIEFSEWFNFRYLDAGYDAAFLAMDLEARGHEEMADELFGRYVAASQDETMPVLQPLHRCFRAFVRGKVESIGAVAPEVPAEERRRLHDSAARYFRLAADYAERRSDPALVVLTGLSGTGKTTAGGALAGRIGAALVSSDPVRRSLGGPSRMWQRFEEGAYSPDLSRRTYEEMRRRAAAHLAAGRPVVLDATHARAADRRAAMQVARQAGAPALIVELRVSDDAALARVIAREWRGHETEVDEQAYRRHVEAFEPISPGEGHYLALDASQTISALAREIAESLPR
jgi:aminoglycoside phosphotransferase family enzyme/predicted kinase